MTDRLNSDVPTDVPDTDGIVVEHVSHAFDGKAVLRDINLEVRPREIVTLLGPSGCGKTTMLRLIAGLEELQSGRIYLDGRILADGVINVPPEQRSASLLFQDFALFPHLTVIDNVIFGLVRWPEEERRARALHVLDQVGMVEYADKFPHQLSGGQQQRVALARARGPRPRLMLMDEPFSSLDTTLRRQVRDVVLWVLQNSVSATLLVTHDPEEAMFMSDRIAVIENSHIVQMGSPQHLYHAPASRFVLSLFGEVNSFVGVVAQGHIVTPLGPMRARGLQDGTRAEVCIRAEDMRLDPESTIRSTVVTSRMVGRQTLLHLDLISGEGEPIHVHARLTDPVPPAMGERVGLAVDSQQVFVFPIASS
jgi:iron(III) transport system ATP-binding protein